MWLLHLWELGGCQAIQLREGLTGPQRAGIVGVEGQKHNEMSDFANEDRCARNSRQTILWKEMPLHQQNRSSALYEPHRDSLVCSDH